MQTEFTEPTFRRAVRASLKDGRLRFVFATALGPRLTLRRPVFQDCLYTNGLEHGI